LLELGIGFAFVGSQYHLETVQEAIEIAEDVAKILLDLKKENNQGFQLKDLPSQFEYPLSMETNNVAVAAIMLKYPKYLLLNWR